MVKEIPVSLTDKEIATLVIHLEQDRYEWQQGGLQDPEAFKWLETLIDKLQTALSNLHVQQDNEMPF